MSSLGALWFDIGVNIARLQTDMQAARGAVNDAMRSVQRDIDTVKGAFAALGGAWVVNQFQEMVHGTIAATARLNELAIQTGSTASQLSALAAVGKLSGTGAEEIASSMNRLAKNMLMANDESKGTGAAIAALGLNLQEFQGLSPDQKMLAVANAMDEFQDGSEKSAVAMQLFGKQGATLLPFFKDLAETGTLQAKVTNEQAAQAEEFERNIRKLQTSGDAWKKELTLGMLPALNEAGGAMLGVVNGSGGLRDEIKRLAADGTIAEWTRTLINGLTYVMDGFSGVKTVVLTLGEVIGSKLAQWADGFGALGAAFMKVLRGDFSGAMDEMNQSSMRIVTMQKELEVQLDKTWSTQTLGSKLRERMADMKNMAATAEATKPKLDTSDMDGKNAKAMEEAVKVGLNFVAMVKLKEAEMQQELDLGRKLTPVEQENLKLTQALASGKMVMSKATEDATRATLAHTAEMMREAKSMQDAYAENNKYIDGMDKKAEKLEEEVKKQREANDLIGLTAEQIALVRSNRLLEMAVAEERLAVLKDEIDLTGQLGDSHRRLAAYYRASASEVVRGEHLKAAKEARDAWDATTKCIGQGLTDAFFSAFENGKSLWVSFRDYLVKVFVDGILKKAIVETIQEALLAAGVSDWLKGLFGSIKGAIGSIFGSGVSSIVGGGAAAGAGAAGAVAIGGGAAGAGGLGIGAGAAGAGGIGSGIGGSLGSGSAISGTGAGAGIYGGGAGAGAGTAGSGGGGFALGTGTALIGAGLLAWYGLAQNHVDYKNFAETLGIVGKGGTLESHSAASGLPESASTIAAAEAIAKAIGANPDFGPGTHFSYTETVRNGLPIGEANIDGTRLGYRATLGSADDFARLLGYFSGISKGDGTTGGGYADGGFFGGGLRLVGERGPELEVTGPSRIYSNQQTVELLRAAGGGGGKEVESLLGRVVDLLAANLAKPPAKAEVAVSVLAPLGAEVAVA